MESSQPKWEGKTCARLRGPTADQVWPLLEDFFNLHKWFPTLASCHGVQGLNGQPGCIRYCAGFSIPSFSGNDDNRVSWSTERLLTIDPISRCLSYEIVDSNIGFKAYVSTIKVSPESHCDQLDGCTIEWSFTVDPVEGWRLEDLVSKFELGLQRMAEKMEEALH